MMRRADRRRRRGGQALVARLLAIAYLLASLLAPHLAEAASPDLSHAPSSVISAAADQDGAPGTASRSHGMVHAGSHCACQLADRLAPAAWVGPSAHSTPVQPAFTSYAHASHKAEPPARPPRD